MHSKSLIPEKETWIISGDLIKQVGLERAIVLQQIQECLDASGTLFHGKKWVHNTYLAWQKHFSFWPLKKTQRIFRALEEEKLLVSFSKCHQLQKTKYYTINYEGTLPMQNQHSPSQHQESQRVDNSSTFDVPNLSHRSSEAMSQKGTFDHSLRGKQKSECLSCCRLDCAVSIKIFES